MGHLKINDPDPKKNGYLVFYNGKVGEVWADTLFQAKQLAEAFFKPPKSKRHLLSVHLAEKPGGEVVAHVADF